MYYDNKENITARLLRFIETERYVAPDGCLQFIRLALHELGVTIEAVPGSSLRDGRLFRRVDEPEFGDVIVLRNLPWPYSDGARFHVGLMLDRRWCIQSASSTNGVARLDISRFPISACEKTFYRPRILDKQCHAVLSRDKTGNALIGSATQRDAMPRKRD